MLGGSNLQSTPVLNVVTSILVSLRAIFWVQRKRIYFCKFLIHGSMAPLKSGLKGITSCCTVVLLRLIFCSFTDSMENKFLIVDFFRQKYYLKTVVNGDVG